MARRTWDRSCGGCVAPSSSSSSGRGVGHTTDRRRVLLDLMGDVHPIGGAFHRGAISISNARTIECADNGMGWDGMSCVGRGLFVAWPGAYWVDPSIERPWRGGSGSGRRRRQIHSDMPLPIMPRCLPTGITYCMYHTIPPPPQARTTGDTERRPRRENKPAAALRVFSVCARRRRPIAV